MNIRTVVVFSVVVAVLTSAPIWAGPVGVEHLSPAVRSMVLSVLERRERRIGRELPEPPKGPALVRYMARRAEIRQLINRIQSGQPVSADEIDQQLWPADY